MNSLSVWSIDGGPAYRTGCYASLFSPYYVPNSKKAKSIESLISVSSSFPIRAANWLLYRVFLPMIPTRVQPHFTISRVFSKTYGTHPLFLKQKESVYVNNNLKPWISIKADATEITATDLFFLLAILRLPQENPKIVEESYQLWKENPDLDPLKCFEFVYMFSQPANHAFLQYRHGLIGFVDELNDYSLAEVWKTLPVGSTSYSRSLGKQNIYEYSQPGQRRSPAKLQYANFQFLQVWNRTMERYECGRAQRVRNFQAEIRDAIEVISTQLFGKAVELPKVTLQNFLYYVGI